MDLLEMDLVDPGRTSAFVARSAGFSEDGGLTASRRRRRGGWVVTVSIDRGNSFWHVPVNLPWLGTATHTHTARDDRRHRRNP